ncbi:hypothetical protein LTSEMON_1628 [Salmonella enterica subsp. enterica serovar Montevideo str. S5-403]|uniref:Uncharacterized protein n=1 Tax=Salmonella enterica subsp. enterica serovar Montevideo str. S5-403 TaxID=913242 RepID=G5Q1A8_SALMO|nr:hypothetical protein LTSEMON_1628 [Salmonella enterica subsp. enterica serovar Montevideo str. S5-403]
MLMQIIVAYISGDAPRAARALRLRLPARRARNADANGHLQYTPALILKLARAIQSAS